MIRSCSNNPAAEIVNAGVVMSGPKKGGKAVLRDVSNVAGQSLNGHDDEDRRRRRDPTKPPQQHQQVSGRREEVDRRRLVRSLRRMKRRLFLAHVHSVSAAGQQGLPPSHSNNNSPIQV